MAPKAVPTSEHIVSTVCPLDCPDACSLDVTVQEGKVTVIDGSTANPVTGGYICAKVRRFPERMYGPDRVLHPAVRRGPKGAGWFERVSWDAALDRIARLMKDDRDKNFIAKNRDGATVNRWITTGFLAASATTNETAFLTYKVVRGTGMLVFDNQARV